MPPEVMTRNKYTEKIDCFSFGVLVIQVLTREFPNPGDRTIYIDDPRVEYAIAVHVPEVERRQKHISKIDPSHLLLPIALDCLKDRDVERPTAHQLCEKIEALKGSQLYYVESKRNASISDTDITDLHDKLITERQRHKFEQEHNQKKIHQLRDEIKQKEAVKSWRHKNQSSLKVEVGFKSIQIFRNQILGRGDFGQVCKAKGDDLLCAAKMFYPDLCRPHLIGIIEQEYQFLSSLRHPNIVQYLTMDLCHDPRTGQVGILMELMDENLTQYLERSSQPVPYHLHVNISHDVALALSFLHANNIVHRNITGNNILLTANAQVIKVCDFVSSAIDTFKANDDDLIIFSSTPVYMPAEAVTGNPKYYTEKIDCFSFGVVVIQILTREYPNPGDGLSYHRVIAPEIERRQNHISKIDPSHPLLSIALDCLKDRDVVRPSAHQLCERIGALKESHRYVESKTRTSVSEKGIQDLREQLVTERQQHISEQEYNQKEIHRLREEIKQKGMLIADIFENTKHQQRLVIERELQNERRQISQLEQQVVQSQEETRRVERELTQQLRYKQFQLSQREQELTQSRQQISDMQQQIRTEQQRVSQSQTELTQARQQMSNLQQLVHVEQQRASQSQTELTQARQEISREREQVHEKEIETSGSHLQLLPRGNSWNVPRREIQITKQIGYGAAGLVSKGCYQGQEVAVK